MSGTRRRYIFKVYSPMMLGSTGATFLGLWRDILEGKWGLCDPTAPFFPRGLLFSGYDTVKLTDFLIIYIHLKNTIKTFKLTREQYNLNNYILSPTMQNRTLVVTYSVKLNFIHLSEIIIHLESITSGSGHAWKLRVSPFKWYSVWLENILVYISNIS